MVVDSFLEIAHRVVWCTLATVDRHGRPRSRIVHPIWERDGDGLTGWVVTRPTALKRAHLEHSPYVSCSYWDQEHDVATAECRASWSGDLDRAFALFRAAEPPLGYDPATLAPARSELAVLRLEPWRLRSAPVSILSTGGEALVWTGSRCSATPATTSATPATSTAVGT